MRDPKHQAPRRRGNTGPAIPAPPPLGVPREIDLDHKRLCPLVTTVSTHSLIDTLILSACDLSSPAAGGCTVVVYGQGYAHGRGMECWSEQQVEVELRARQVAGPVAARAARVAWNHRIRESGALPVVGPVPVTIRK